MEMKVRMDVRAVRPWHVPTMACELISDHLGARTHISCTFVGESAKESNAGLVCLRISIRHAYQTNAASSYILAVITATQDTSGYRVEMVQEGGLTESEG